MKTKSALSYFGSDSEVAKELASMLDHCSHVTIPFCGGLSILPHLKARAIVANDKNRAALNFYRHMNNPSTREELIELCQATLSHPDELADAQVILASIQNGTVVQAWAYWALCWIARKGKGGTKNQGGLPSVRRTASGGSNASRIRAAADDLHAWAKQFERCEFESIDFRELLVKVADNRKCGVYCDPPWVQAGMNYLHAFNGQDHEELATALSRFRQTTVVVRYWDSEFIRSLYPGWSFLEAASRNQCNAVKGEIWITNK